MHSAKPTVSSMLPVTKH